MKTNHDKGRYLHIVWAAAFGTIYGIVIIVSFPTIDGALIFGAAVVVVLSLIFTCRVSVRRIITYNSFDRITAAICWFSVSASFMVALGIWVLIDQSDPRTIPQYFLNHADISELFYVITDGNLQFLSKHANAGQVTTAYFVMKPITAFLDLLCATSIFLCCFIFLAQTRRFEKKSFKIKMTKINIFYSVSAIFSIFFVGLFYILFTFFNFDLNTEPGSAVAIHRRQTITPIARPLMSLFFASTVYVIAAALIRVPAVRVVRA